MNPPDSQSIKDSLAKLDSLELTEAEALALSKVYESINIVLRAQIELVRNKAGLRIVED